MNVPCDREYTTPDEWVVFVKSFDGIEQAKRDGCLVCLDPVDYYCYGDGREFRPIPEVDLLVVPNKACAGTYRGLFPNADFLIVPHQWDDRITGQCEHDAFRAAYIGRKFNLTEHLAVDMVTDEADQLAALPRYNCHVSHRSWDAAVWRKPATKVASAAAVGAVVVTTPDMSSKYLLGEEYPFYAPGTLFDGLYRAKKAFGTQQWAEAREIMAGVRERTSLAAVADLYRVLM